MPKKIYSPAQLAHLKMVSEIHLKKVKAKALLRAEIEATLNDALNDIALEESRAANEAINAGVTRTDVGRALGTANWESIKNILARTENTFKAEDFDPRNQKFTLNPDNTITVTLTTDEVLWEQDNYMDVKNRNVPHSGTFEKHPVGGWHYKKQDGDPTFQVDGHVNPLTYWSRRAENIRELTEWAESRGSK